MDSLDCLVEELYTVLRIEAEYGRRLALILAAIAQGKILQKLAISVCSPGI